MSRLKALLKNRKEADGVWYLQTSGDDFQFWDNYIHPSCKLIKLQKENPFKKHQSAATPIPSGTIWQ